MTTTTVHPTRTSLSRTAIAVVGAAAGAVALWAVETGLLGVDLAVRAGDVVQPVTGVSVAATALVAGLAATLTAWLLARIAPRRCRTVWTVVAGGVLLVSLLGPLGATSAAAVVSLVALHLLVGLTLLVGVRGSFTGPRGYGE
jgi:hypothetical protein